MPLVTTPGQLQHRAEFYRQLAGLTHAGIPILRSLQQLAAHPPSRATGEQAGHLLTLITQGRTLTESFRALRPPIPSFDLALLEAGEQSGRLDSAFNLLAGHYELRAQVARATLADLMYPAFLLHFAVFILPFADFFATGNFVRYLAQTLGLLLPLYAVVLLGVYAMRGSHGEAWRARMERLLRAVPVLGAARQQLALARLAAALQALLDAGIPVLRAWELAAEASGSPALRREIGRWPPLLALGQTPAELVRASPVFPQLFASLYAGGEVSGRLDHELRHLQAFLSEEGSRQMKTFWSWAPKIIYLLIALAIAYKIISFYAGYFSRITQEL